MDKVASSATLRWFPQGTLLTDTIKYSRKTEKRTAYSCAALSNAVKLELTLSECLWWDTKFSHTRILLWECGRRTEAQKLPAISRTPRDKEGIRFNWTANLVYHEYSKDSTFNPKKGQSRQVARFQRDVTCNLDTVGKDNQGLISLCEVLSWSISLGHTSSEQTCILDNFTDKTIFL